MFRFRTLAFTGFLLSISTSTLAQEPETGDVGAWKNGAVCYEVFVRSFHDSDGDGAGDLRGLITKLDYINDGNPSSRSDLGARCIWLMPVAQSPSYHGYDVTDYYRVERDYGTNDDFKLLVFEAHQRGIRVLVDLVLNHVSSQHPYFKDALRNPASPYRDWFVWSPTKPGNRSPWGTEAWHRSPVRNEYYYGVFWSGMPDLNYANPVVRDAAVNVARFWTTKMGVDGFRLDAIPYLVEEDGVIKHTPGTHAVLREFAAHLHEFAPHAFTIGEVWDSTGAVLPYYPDQLDAYFAFGVSDAILNAVRSGSRDGLFAPILQLQRQLPADRWAPFLTNHDQTRTVTALGGDVRKAKLAGTLLLTLPGLPFVYYGEELGMTGDKPDPRIRTPMAWNRDPGVGFTTGVAWEPLAPDSHTANVEALESDSGSILNLYRRLIHLRGENPALATGTLVPLTATSTAIVAFLRQTEDRTVMVIVNLATVPTHNVSISSDPRVLPPGYYELRTLHGPGDGAPFEVGENGRLASYVPLAEVPALGSYVFELVRR